MQAESVANYEPEQTTSSKLKVKKNTHLENWDHNQIIQRLFATMNQRLVMDAKIASKQNRYVAKIAKKVMR